MSSLLIPATLTGKLKIGFGGSIKRMIIHTLLFNNNSQFKNELIYVVYNKFN